MRSFLRPLLPSAIYAGMFLLKLVTKKPATLIKYSSRLRPGTKSFTCGKWIIGYNFDIDDGAEWKFGIHEELMVLKILKHKHGVNKSRDMSPDNFAKNRKLLTNWWPVYEKKSGKNLFLIHIKYFWHFMFGVTVHCTSIKNYERKHQFKCPNLILNYLKLWF